MSSSFKSSKSSIASFSVVPNNLLNRPLIERWGDVGIDPSGRPGVERYLGREVGVPQGSNDGRRGEAVEVSGWGRDTGH